MDDDSNSVQVDAYLVQLIISLEAAAMQQMGKLQNPLTGKVEKDLEMAKGSIDMLAMVQKKTEGNLTETEANLLKRTLYQLRMNYVEEKNSEEKADSEDQSTESDDDDKGEPGVEEGTNSDKSGE